MQIKDYISIIYEDRDLVACEKQPTMLTLPAENGEKSLIDYLYGRYEENGEKIELFPLHRLDRLTGGIVVFAKNKATAAALSAVFAEHKNTKEYYAVLEKAPEIERAKLRDMLFADKRANKSYIVDRARRGAKEAVLSYEVKAKTSDGKHELALVNISLHTGRMHQIRAQLSHIGSPVLGDGKYGSRENKCSLALWAYHLSFSYKKREYDFYSYPSVSEYPWSFFENEIK